MRKLFVRTGHRLCSCRQLMSRRHTNRMVMGSDEVRSYCVPAHNGTSKWPGDSEEVAQSISGCQVGYTRKDESESGLRTLKNPSQV